MSTIKVFSRFGYHAIKNANSLLNNIELPRRLIRLQKVIGNKNVVGLLKTDK